RAGDRVDAGEVATVLGLLPKSRADLLPDLVLAELRGPILCQPRDAGLSGEPVAGPVDVEVRRLVGQPPKGIAEGRDRLPGLGAPELDLLVRKPLVRHV